MIRNIESMKPDGITIENKYRHYPESSRLFKDVTEGFFFGQEAKSYIARFMVFGSMTFLTLMAATAPTDTTRDNGNSDTSNDKIVTVSPDEISRASLRSFMMSEIFRRTGGVLDTSWDVITIDPVKIRVADKAGINLRDFPDKRIGNIVGALQYNPDPEKFVEGEFSKFVPYKDRNGAVIDIWVSMESDSQRRFFCVYENGQLLANLIYIKQQPVNKAQSQ